MRILAHEIVVDGITYKLHSATADSHGNIRLEPFSGETCSTLFIDGKIEVWFDKELGRIQWRQLA